MKLIGIQNTKLSYLKSITYPCKLCGNTKLRHNNLRGWTEKSVECPVCGQIIKGDTIGEAIEEWNKNNNQETNR